MSRLNTRLVSVTDAVMKEHYALDENTIKDKRLLKIKITDDGIAIELGTINRIDKEDCVGGERIEKYIAIQVGSLVSIDASSGEVSTSQKCYDRYYISRMGIPHITRKSAIVKVIVDKDIKLQDTLYYVAELSNEELLRAEAKSTKLKAQLKENTVYLKKCRYRLMSVSNTLISSIGKDSTNEDA